MADITVLLQCIFFNKIITADDIATAQLWCIFFLMTLCGLYNVPPAISQDEMGGKSKFCFKGNQFLAGRSALFWYSFASL